MMYVVMRRDPSNQFVLGVPRQIETVKIDRTYNMISKCGKFKVMGLSAHHPTNTVRGTTKSDIWVQDPTATPMARSIFGIKSEKQKSLMLVS